MILLKFGSRNTNVQDGSAKHVNVTSDALEFKAASVLQVCMDRKCHVGGILLTGPCVHTYVTSESPVDVDFNNRAL